jgi:hypothetical protein
MSLFNLFLSKTQNAVIKVLSSENYTILDNDGYTEILVTTGASDRTISLPTLADNQFRKIKIKKIDAGAGKVIVTPEGAEKINSWNATVEITEQWGCWDFTACSAEWEGETEGYSTIYRVESSANINLASGSSTLKADVLTLSNLPVGTYELIGEGIINIVNTVVFGSVQIYLGIGKTSGDNPIDIILDSLQIIASADDIGTIHHTFHPTKRYINTTVKDLYLKVGIACD